MNYYDLFEIQICYKIDEMELTEIYLKKQSVEHPDMNNDSSSENSSYLNAAYKTLLDPIKRAEYFLELKGVDTGAISAEIGSEMFAMREKYESLVSEEEKEKFRKVLYGRMQTLLDSLNDLERNIYEFAKKVILLRFINSFLEKVKIDVYSRY